MRRVSVPGDKSITHRALILAALASGRSTLRRPLIAGDTQSTAAALRALGTGVPELAEDTVIDGVGLRGLTAPAGPIDCGNSGTTARLLMGVLAGCPFEVVLTGDASLCARPMRRVTEPLSLMGAVYEELERPDRLPVRARGGALRPLRYTSPHASAQVKSAILLAGLTGSADVEVKEPVASRDHTERMLARIGVPLTIVSDDAGGRTVTLRPVAELAPFTLDVPGDISSAAFLIAFGCLAARNPIRIEHVGLNPTRTGFLDVVRRMGARIHVEDARESCGEPVGDLIVEPGPLRATEVAAEEVPSMIDEFPVLAVMAARARGTTVVDGAAELRVKESDRIRAIVENLRAVGADAEERPEGMTIRGGTGPLRGAVTTRHDHRIAMAFAVLSAVSGGRIEIDDMGVADVSFPGFGRLLDRLAGGVDA